MTLAIFFEGTGHGVAGRVTNVTRLHDACADDARQRLHLESGVGTRFGAYIAGRVAGVDWRATFRSACQWYKEARAGALPRLSCKVLLFGFSRGALLARHFAAWLGRNGVPVAYLGLWDTVDSTIGLDVDEQCPGNVLHARHAVSRDEERKFFQYVPLRASGGNKVEELLFPGCHSDVGGLFDDNHAIADLSLAWIGAGAKKAGLRMKKGVRFAQTLDRDAVVLHDSHGNASNLWGAFDRVRRDLKGLKMHRAVRSWEL